MTWAPTKKIADTRFLGQNVLNFVVANQGDALVWANGASLKPMKPLPDALADITKPIFPLLTIVSENDGTEFSGDILQSIYQITFLVEIEGKIAAAVPPIAEKYKHALESMLLNIDKTSLFSGVSGLSTFAVVSIETEFQALQKNKMQNQFFQIFQTKVVYLLTGEAYG